MCYAATSCCICPPPPPSTHLLAHTVVRSMPKDEVVAGKLHVLTALRAKAVGVKLLGVFVALQAGRIRQGLGASRVPGLPPPLPDPT